MMGKFDDEFGPRIKETIKSAFAERCGDTMRGMLDLEHEVYVAEEFWNFLAGKDVYDDLLDCFEEAGIESGNAIDAYFKKYACQDIAPGRS